MVATSPAARLKLRRSTLPPAERLCRRMAAVVRPRPLVDRAAWCERELRLPAETNAENTNFDLGQFPWVRGWLAAVDDPETQIISIMGGTQVGKTTYEQAVLASFSQLAPAPMMLAGPDRDFVRELRDKVYRLGEESAAIAPLLPPPQRRNDRWIDLGNCVCYLAWSGNTQRLSGKACKRVLCTEVDRWRRSPRHGNTAKLVAERVKAFARSLIIYEGNPTDDAGTIATLWDESDRRRFLVPCPHCGHYQELRFFPHKEGPYVGCGGLAGMQNDAGDFLSTDDVVAKVYYRCEQGCRIENDEKWDFVPAGVWCPEGQRVEQGQLRGQPKRSPRHAGFQISSLYSLTLTWGKVAVEYLRSRVDVEQLRVWWNNWLGLPFSVKARMPKWTDIGKRLEGRHPRTKAPQPAVFLTAGCDVQEDCVYYVVRAWGEGCTSWLVDWGRINQKLGRDGMPISGSDLSALDEQVFYCSFALVEPNPLGQAALRVLKLAIDVNYRAHEVHRYAKGRPGDRIRCVAGQAGLMEPWTRSVVEKSARDGKPYPGGLERWGINTDQFKADIQGRWSSEPGQPGGWWAHARAIQSAETYLRQIVNEGPTTKRNKAGHKARVWEVIDKRAGNHYWDCEVYARAMAEMITGGDWEGLVERAQGGQRAAQRPRKSRHEKPELPR